MSPILTSRTFRFVQVPPTKKHILAEHNICHDSSYRIGRCSGSSDGPSWQHKRNPCSGAFGRELYPRCCISLPFVPCKEGEKRFENSYWKLISLLQTIEHLHLPRFPNSPPPARPPPAACRHAPSPPNIVPPPPHAATARPPEE